MEIFGWFYFNLVAVLMFLASVMATDVFSEALLSLKSDLLDDFNALSDWSVPYSEPNPSAKIAACSWSGITCEQNSTIITQIDLSRKKLAGEIQGKYFSLFVNLTVLNLSYNAFSGQLPIELFNLTSLQSLDISRNNFSGEFPSGVSGLYQLEVLDAFSNSFIGPLPVEASQIETLKVLNLAGSYFSGQIPSQYGFFKSLEFIHLAGNFLGGQIPKELGNLKTLTHMEIGYNSYQSFIPVEFGNMSELQYLDIAGANLSGSIPKELSNLTKLESLFLFKNQISGLIPWEFSRITTLTNLDLSDNLLSGPIPESFAEFKNLRLLSVMYNYMNGSVPEGIAELPQLETLLIWDNFFSGSLPMSLGKNSNLKWLDVSTNDFEGQIPPNVCAGGVLCKLILFSNKFTGSLSPAISNCSSLVRLRVEDNSFSGDIPLKFSDLPDITYVDLSRNRFTGGIPIDIFQAPKLQYFNVSNNVALGGTIAAKTWLLPALQNFSASNSNISGNLPQFQFCRHVSVIELHSNHLSGTIPKSISSCQALERLSFANNSLNGHIPEELASLGALSILDLSHNNFNGSIPAKFGTLSSLLLLNVSFNDILGSIPSEKRFRLMGSSAFVGNPNLCGAPLEPCTSSDDIQHVFKLGDKISSKLTLVLLVSAGVALFFILVVLGIVYFQKGSKRQWNMLSFVGLPQFTANDVLRSFSTAESIEEVPSASVCKALLPTGITVSVKKIKLEAKRIRVMSELITQMGNSRHKNLVRLLGFCHNKHVAYLLYDYLAYGNLAENIRIKRDWETKYKIVMGVAKGLCYLHHDCYPAIPHGNLKSSNILFDENMEPQLADFGFKLLVQLNEGLLPEMSSTTDPISETGKFHNIIKDELYVDIFNFGEVLLEILSSGRLTNAGRSIQNKPRNILFQEIYQENDVGNTSSLQKEIKTVLDVALLCTRGRPSDRPSMQDALKLLSVLKPERKEGNI
ncbi:Serine-threonine/tyrosine-protein kinase, catalytic domain [Dillenia turbinata]|uniref:Serine-threonine/tyrosine-protein kinase, catalytic domain n=1 Tax=Dillenia turbinata TaxID=194707 RepID=A0AAN8W5Z5_9MAGN